MLARANARSAQLAAAAALPNGARAGPQIPLRTAFTGAQPSALVVGPGAADVGIAVPMGTVDPFQSIW
jgi:hypothetical protein